MSYNSTTGVISAPVSIRDVQLALGNSSGDLKTLCTAPSVNPWSWKKPLNYNVLFASDAVLKMQSGYKSSQYATGFGAIQVLTYDPPVGGITSPYRLLDFNGYNHIAPAYSANMKSMSYVGAPAGTNIYIGTADNSATFTVEVCFPEIPVWKFPGNETGIVKISRGILGTNNFKEIVGKLDVAAACANNDATYAANYAGKTIPITCTQTQDLPGNGQISMHDYYVTFGDSYPISLEYNHLTGKMYRQYVKDPGSTSDYIDVVPETALSPVDNYYVYSRFAVLPGEQGDIDGNSYLYLYEFHHRVTGRLLDIEYYHPTNGWTPCLSIRNSVSDRFIFKPTVTNYNDSLGTDQNGYITGTISIAVLGVERFRILSSIEL